MDGIPHGQLFGIIKKDSPGTAMPWFMNLKEMEIWQRVLYLREFAK